MNLKTTHLKRVTASTVVVALVLCQGFVTGTPLTQVVSKLQNYVTGASTAKALHLPAAAHLSAHGAVTLNGHAAPTGATVFSGGGVKTAENSSAVLSFGAMGQVELTSTSDFTLAVEGTMLGGQLRAGRATIVAPAGVAVKIVTADGPIVTNGKDAVVLTVDVTAGKARVETSGALANVKTPAGVTPMPLPQSGCACQLTPDQLKRINEKLAKIRRAAEMINRKGGTIDMADVDTLETAARRGDQSGFDAALKRILATKSRAQISQLETESLHSTEESNTQHGPYSPPLPDGPDDLYLDIETTGNEIKSIMGMSSFPGGGMGGGGGGGMGGGAGGMGGGGLGALLGAAGLAAGLAAMANNDNDNPVSPIQP